MKKAIITLLMLVAFNYLYCANFKDMTNIERFEQKVYPEPNTGCWLWGGAYNYKGYGKVGQVGHNKFNLAHRYSYFIYNGEFDLKLKVLHKCDNPSCVNPDHLFLGTQHDNIKDMYQKGRAAVGEKVPRSKLDKNKVIEIRELYASGNHSFSTLSKIYNVGDAAICKVVNKQNWKHVS